MNATVVDIRDLWFSYNGQPILKAVNLRVRRGDFLALIGPNGGGKTTLLKLMLGLIKPDRGTIRVLDLNPRQAAHRIGYVPPHRFDLTTGAAIILVAGAGFFISQGIERLWSGHRTGPGQARQVDTEAAARQLQPPRGETP